MENTFKNKTSYKAGATIKENMGIGVLEMIFFIGVILYYLLPVVNSRVPFMMAVILFTIYALYQFISEKPYGKFCLYIVLASIAFTVIHVLLVDSNSISHTVSNYYIKRIFSKYNQVFTTFFPAILFLKIRREASNKQKKSLFIIMTLAFSLVLINTFIELLKNPTASRDWTEFASQSESNVGTYSYIYATVILLVGLVSLFSKGKKMRNILTLIIVIALIFFLIYAQYTLAILISIVGIVFQTVRSVKNNAGKILLIIFLIIMLLFLPKILGFLANVIPSEQISVRLKEIASFFGEGDNLGYNLNGRLTLYKKTILAFFSSPILGNRSLNFDGHATFLTVFADVGIFGGGLFVYMFHRTKKTIMLNKNREDSKIFSITFVCYVLMGLTNPIHSAQTLAFVLWLFVPLMLELKTMRGA